MGGVGPVLSIAVGFRARFFNERNLVLLGSWTTLNLVRGPFPFGSHQKSPRLSQPHDPPNALSVLVVWLVFPRTGVAWCIVVLFLFVWGGRVGGYAREMSESRSDKWIKVVSSWKVPFVEAHLLT